jgi:hypothetical protein
MNEAPRTPGVEKTGPVPVKPQRDEIPVQEMEKFEHDQQGQAAYGGDAAPAMSTPANSGASMTLNNPVVAQPAANPQGAGSAGAASQAPATVGK